jgi:hypothetical protein
LYLGFQSRDYSETPNVAISSHALKRCKFGCDQSKMKGTLVKKQRTLLALSALPFKYFDMDMSNRRGVFTIRCKI